MEQPPGFCAAGQENKVCFLKKSRYGLRASRAWNKKIHEVSIRFTFVQSKSEPCIYMKRRGCNKFVHVALYVDDPFVFSEDVLVKEALYAEMNFDVQFLGPVRN